MQYSNKQQGLTMISIMFLLVAICAVVLTGLKVAPIYMNHGKVIHALESLKNRPDTLGKSKNQIWISLNKQFNMDYIDNIKKKDVKITSRSGYVKVRIVYHVKELLVGNLSVWADFDDMIEVGAK